MREGGHLCSANLPLSPLSTNRLIKTIFTTFNYQAASLPQYQGAGDITRLYTEALCSGKEHAGVNECVCACVCVCVRESVCGCESVWERELPN